MTHDTEHSDQPTTATADFDRQLRRAAGWDQVTTRSKAAGKEGTMADFDRQLRRAPGWDQVTTRSKAAGKEGTIADFDRQLRRAAGRTTEENTDES